jgi:hypothetical protein
MAESFSWWRRERLASLRTLGDGQNDLQVGFSIFAVGDVAGKDSQALIFQVAPDCHWGEARMAFSIALSDLLVLVAIEAQQNEATLWCQDAPRFGQEALRSKGIG